MGVCQQQWMLFWPPLLPADKTTSIKHRGWYKYIDWGWLYGMEMDSYKSRFLDGSPDGYGTTLYSFLYTWGSRGIPIFGLTDFLFWCGDITVRIHIKNLYRWILCFGHYNFLSGTPFCHSDIVTSYCYLAVSPKFFFRQTLVSAVPSASLPYTQLTSTGMNLHLHLHTVCSGITSHLAFFMTLLWVFSVSLFISICINKFV